MQSKYLLFEESSNRLNIYFIDLKNNMFFLNGLGFPIYIKEDFALAIPITNEVFDKFKFKAMKNIGVIKNEWLIENDLVEYVI